MTDLAEPVVHVLRVFTDEDGRHGNLLGVVAGALVDPDDRQWVAHELGFSETVFIDAHVMAATFNDAHVIPANRAAAEVRIFTPVAELPLAGHPLVGTAWYLQREVLRKSPGAGHWPIRVELWPPGGFVPGWTGQDGRQWISAPLDALPDWTIVELHSPTAIDDLTGPIRPEHDHVVYWAWIDTGVVCVRCFAPRFGIVEDEATGSAALRLTTLLAQPLEIRQGKGSLLYARPVDADRASVGGLVVEDDPLPLPSLEA